MPNIVVLWKLPWQKLATGYYCIIVGFGVVHLFGTGAVNAKIDEIWCKTPAMNFSPIADIPCLEDPSDAMKTFLPFCHKLTCTWDPEPISSRSYLSNIKKSRCYSF